MPVTILTPQKRREDNDVRAQYDPVNPTGGGCPGGGPQARPDPNVVPANRVAEQLDQFLVGAGTAARVNDAGREHGQIRAFNNRTFDVTKAVPTVILRNEDYGRLSRVMADGTPVELEINIVNNLDTYERVIEDDVKKSAMVIASAVYHLAMRDQMLPRLPKDKMPALPTNTQ